MAKVYNVDRIISLKFTTEIPTNNRTDKGIEYYAGKFKAEALARGDEMSKILFDDEIFIGNAKDQKYTKREILNTLKTTNIKSLFLTAFKNLHKKININVDNG